jgi:hypothetical protein
MIEHARFDAIPCVRNAVGVVVETRRRLDAPASVPAFRRAINIARETARFLADETLEIPRLDRKIVRENMPRGVRERVANEIGPLPPHAATLRSNSIAKRSRIVS